MPPTAAHPSAAEVTLGELATLVGSWCDRLDPACWAGPDAAAAAEQVAVAARRLQAAGVVLAGRAKACNSFSGRHRSAEAWHASVNGISESEAKRALDTAERLADCPATAAALAAGDISVDEAQLVTSAAVVNPAAEQRLVDQARKHNFADTRTAADRARHQVFSREQEQARLARMRKLRRVRELTDADQLAWIDCHLLPEGWAMARPILDAYTDLEFQTARRQGRREPLDAYRADGLLAALRAAGTYLHNPPPPWGGDGGSPGGGGGDPRPGRPSDSGPSAPTTSTSGLGPATLFGPAADRSDPTHETDPVDRGVEGAVGPEMSDADVSTDRVERSSNSAPPGPSGPRRKSAEVVVLVDAIALRRGYATATETCEIARSGTPVSIDWIADRMPGAAVDVLVHDRVDIRAHTRVHQRRPRRDADLPADERPTVVVLIDALSVVDQPRGLAGAIRLPGTDLDLSLDALRRFVPADIARAVERDLVDIRTYRSDTRHTPRPVRLAVLARDRCCTVPGCRRRQRLERDHVHDHAKGGAATTRNLHGLCDLHHDDKTHRHATVVLTATERLWYPSGSAVALRAPLGEHLNAWDLSDVPRSGAPDLSVG